MTEFIAAFLSVAAGAFMLFLIFLLSCGLYRALISNEIEKNGFYKFHWDKKVYTVTEDRND